MNSIYRLLAFASALAFFSAPVFATDCICFHYEVTPDGTKFLGSHAVECSDTEAASPGISLSGPTFETGVLNRILHDVHGGKGRVVAAPSERGFAWIDTDGNGRSCHVPDVGTWAESQPARTSLAAAKVVTYSINGLSAERTAQVQLAANAWNLSLAAAGMKTRLLQVTDNANVAIVERSLSGLLGSSSANTMGVTVTRKKNPIGSDRLVANALIALNADKEPSYAADAMLPVQVFGHEFGHALGLEDVAGGHQLMSNAMRYTDGSDVESGLKPGDYSPNICETAKLAENGLP